MAGSRSRDSKILPLLDRLASGDPNARDGLINVACGRLKLLARKMLNSFPAVRNFEDSDDIVQSACIRLYRALAAVHPDSPRAFFGLAAKQIQRELIDLVRHYQGPEGQGANEIVASRHEPPGTGFDLIAQKMDSTAGPSTLAEWSEFHSKIAELPLPERDVFEQMFYEGLSRDETARVLGLSYDQVKRLWVSARIHLSRSLKGESPGKSK